MRGTGFGFIGAGVAIALLGLNIDAYIFGGFMAVIGLLVITAKGNTA